MHGNEVWKVEYASAVVEKDIPRLDQSVRSQIKRAIEQKLIHAPLVFSKPLQYSLKGHRRFRVGDYRVVFVADYQLRTLRILVIKHRREVYDE